MSAIELRLTEEIKTAMKSRSQLRLDTLRAMKSALKYKMVELKKSELVETEIIAVLRSLVKQRQDSAEQYEKSGSPERAEKENLEIAVIQEFLPQPISEAELSKMVTEVVSALGASTMKDMGRVMKELGDRLQGRADGRVLSEMVKSKLSASAS